MCSRRKTTEAKSHCHHILSRAHAVDVSDSCMADLDHLAAAVFLRFVRCEATLFLSPFHHNPRKKVTKPSRELCSTSWRAGIYIHYLELFRFDFCFSTYLFNHLFMTLLIHEHLFYTFGYNPILTQAVVSSSSYYEEFDYIQK